jgi:hypothetical protein
MRSEQVREADRRALLVAKLVILLDLAPRRQSPPLRRDALDVAAKLDLLGEEGGSGGPVFGAVVGIGLARSCSERFGGLEIGHQPLSGK